MTQVPSEEVILLPPARSWTPTPERDTKQDTFNVFGSENLTCSICDGLFAFPRLLSSTLLPLYCPQTTRSTRQRQQTHPDLFHQSHRGNTARRQILDLLCGCKWALLLFSLFHAPFSLSVLIFSLFYSLPLFLLPTSFSFLVFLSFNLLLPFYFFNFSSFSSLPMSVFLSNQ